MSSYISLALCLYNMRKFYVLLKSVFSEIPLGYCYLQCNIKYTALKEIYGKSIVLPSFSYQQQENRIQDLLASLDMNYCCPIKTWCCTHFVFGPTPDNLENKIFLLKYFIIKYLNLKTTLRFISTKNIFTSQQFIFCLKKSALEFVRINYQDIHFIYINIASLL